MTKLCVFPNDPLLSYYNKGEIKDRYFNPENFFNEIHVISLFDDEISPDKVKKLSGNADFYIHKLGKADLTNYKKFEKRITKIIQDIQPSIIRAYNPLVQGWLATKIGKKFGIPVVISLHTNYEQQREFLKSEKKIIKYLKLVYTSKQVESFAIKNADVIICVYQAIVPYAKKRDAQNIQIIYNRVSLENFSPDIKKKIQSSIPIIISVGRLIKQKNHLYLLEAIKDLNVKLIIIGNGPNYSKIMEYIEVNNMSEKVQIINSIPNHELGGYYTSCHIYAQPLEQLDGIPIPVLEAMACGLPIVMSEHSDN